MRSVTKQARFLRKPELLLRGDTLVVRKLDRHARSLPDARDIADELAQQSDKPSKPKRR